MGPHPPTDNSRIWLPTAPGPQTSDSSCPSVAILAQVLSWGPTGPLGRRPPRYLGSGQVSTLGGAASRPFSRFGPSGCSCFSHRLGCSRPVAVPPLVCSGWRGCSRPACGQTHTLCLDSLSGRVRSGTGGFCHPAPAVAGRYRCTWYEGAAFGGGLSSGPGIFVAA